MENNQVIDVEEYFQKALKFFTKEAYEAFNKRDYDKYVEVLPDDVVYYRPDLEKPIRGKAAYRKWIESFHNEFPEGRVELIDIRRDKGTSFVVDYFFTTKEARIRGTSRIVYRGIEAAEIHDVQSLEVV